MKRALILLYILLFTLPLSGCSLSLQADRRDAEKLLLVQTMGLDRRGTGVEMSISSGLGVEDKPALVMSAAGSGIEDAIARLQNYSPENQLFYAHVQYLLLGESAARKDLDAVIDWVERNPTVRIDTDLLVVRGSAKDAVVGSSQKSTDITQRLESMNRQSSSTGWTVHTLRQVASALEEGGGALCLAVEAVSAEDTVFTEDMSSDAILPAGYAVLGAGGLLGFLTPEQSLGAELLTGDPTGIQITIDGNALEILDGSAQASGKFSDDGTLEGIDIRCTLRTGLMEKSRGKDADPDKLDASLSETAAQWLAGAVEQAQKLDCDFLDLKSSVLKKSKNMTALGDRWQDLFPTLPVTVTVNGWVDRSYDLSE